MSKANPLWGAPRIHGELLKLGINISPATVGRWMPWRPKVPSPTWRSYALMVLSLDRRQVVHFAITANPTQDWLARQMTEAFPWDTAPRYLQRDRDKSYGLAFRHRVRALGITEVITAPRSPWQNPYAERLIGSIRRECLDHVLIFNERHLRRVLSVAAAVPRGVTDIIVIPRVRPWPAFDAAPAGTGLSTSPRPPTLARRPCRI